MTRRIRGRDAVRVLGRRLRTLIDPTREDRATREEMLGHLEEEIRERIATGMSPTEARRTAMRDFGGLETYRTVARQERWGHGLELFLRDLRLAARRLSRTPSHSGTAVLCLAVGLAAATTVSETGRALLDAPWPWAHSDRIVSISSAWEGRPDGTISPAELLDLEARTGDVLQAVGGVVRDAATVAGDAGAQRVSAAWVTSGLFDALGIEAAHGRTFTAEEVRDGAARVVLSHGAWTERFASDPNVLGRHLPLVGSEAEIVGVLPPGMDLPGAVFRGEPTELFFPLPLDPARVQTRGNHYLDAWAVRREGVGPGTARSAIERLGREMVQEHPSGYPSDMRFRLLATSLDDRLRGPLRAPVGILGAAAAFLALVALADVAGLFLTRLDRRSRETALSLALGAGRFHLVRQAVAEAIVLGSSAAVLGLLPTLFGLAVLHRLLPPELAHLVRPTLSPALVATIVTGAVLAIAALSLVPLGALRGHQLADRLVRFSRGEVGVRSGSRARRALVAGQVAVTVVLLTIGSLLGRGLSRLVAVDPGYATANRTAVRVDAPMGAGRALDAPVDLHRRVAERVAASPGVARSSAVSAVVLDGSLGDMSFEIEGHPVPENRQKPAADWLVVLPGYFETMGIPLRAGRPLEERDDVASPGAVVVDTTFVARHFPDGDALGQRIRLGGEKTSPRWATIVGIAGEVRHGRLDEEPRPLFYFAHAQFRLWTRGQALADLHHLVVSDGDPARAARAVRRAAADVDPGLAVGDVRPLDDLRDRALGLPRLLAALPTGFSLAALFLAAVGISGVIAAGVTSRRAEIGVRRALGATSDSLVALVVREAALATSLGAVLGAAGAFAVGRWIEARFPMVESAADPATWTIVGLCLLGATLAAGAVPVRRALRVDPSRLLRSDS